jgi:predicted dehydrogenase
MDKKNQRREFIKKTALGAAAVTLGPLSTSAKSYSRILGANDRLGVAILGCYRRFGALSDSLSQLENVDVAYVCDVDSRRQEKAVGTMKKLMNHTPKGEKDLRKIIQQPDVDAIFVAIPDHWHAAATWMGLDAGKHVYVEKPCSHNPMESELLIALQKKYGLVVQMGNQQRSAPDSQEIIQEIHNGRIGDVFMATAFYSNGRGRVPDAKKTPVPDYLDWELWQGPAPRTEFVDILGDYMWHWFWTWGTAETGNNATHELDVARWALKVDRPTSVQVNAGKYHFKDDPWTMYDTMDATFTFAGDKIIKWDGKSRNSYNTYGADRGTVIYGSEGTVFVNRAGYRLYDRGGKLLKEQSGGGDESSTGLGGGGGMTTRHVGNFLDAIRGKAKQNSNIEDGALSTNLSHYANISARMNNARLEIDPATGKFKDKKVMKKYWGREYEKGWEPPKI